MLTATGPLASSPTLRPARTPAKNGCRCGASLDQGSELRARIVLVRRANITRMRLMYGPELSCLSEPVREQLLFVLAGLTSFESWDQMRHCWAFRWRPGNAFDGPRSTECCRREDEPPTPVAQRQS